MVFCYFIFVLSFIYLISHSCIYLFNESLLLSIINTSHRALAVLCSLSLTWHISV